MYEAEDDRYCYAGTSVLKNRFDIRDPAQLEALEVELTTARSEEPLPDGIFDEAHFRAIHHHLFQDLYDWAGETREVRLSKGASHFCYPEHIDPQLDGLFGWLHAENHLRDLPLEEFAPRAAHFLSELNVIHTFREGNGRAQMAFMVLLAEEAGYPLQLDRMEPQAFLKAMITAFFGDEKPLAASILRLAQSEEAGDETAAPPAAG